MEMEDFAAEAKMAAKVKAPFDPFVEMKEDMGVFTKVEVLASFMGATSVLVDGDIPWPEQELAAVVVVTSGGSKVVAKKKEAVEIALVRMVAIEVATWVIAAVKREFKEGGQMVVEDLMEFLLDNGEIQEVEWEWAKDDGNIVYGET